MDASAAQANSRPGRTRLRASNIIATVQAPIGISVRTTCSGSPSQVPLRKFLSRCAVGRPPAYNALSTSFCSLSSTGLGAGFCNWWESRPPMRGATAMFGSLIPPPSSTMTAAVANPLDEMPSAQARKSALPIVAQGGCECDQWHFRWQPFRVESGALYRIGKPMHPAILATFLETSGTAAAMCSAGIAVFLIAVWAAKNAIAEARSLDKIVALSNLCFAVPLAVFGALHLFGPQFVMNIVPRYMPWRMFWVYAVGCALIAASLSIATKIGVRWSGLLFGMMMFLFVAMIHFPGALRQPHNRIIWTIVFREMSFGGAGWILAGNASDAWPRQAKGTLITVGRILVAITAIFFGVEHFLHPTGLPGVPLVKQMPAWVPGQVFIDYVMGAALLVAGGSILLNRKTRTVATWAGGWILLMVLVIYGPVLIVALSDPGIAVKVEGINYFADTLLFAGVILAAASATPRSDVGGRASVPLSIRETLSPARTEPSAP